MRVLITGASSGIGYELAKEFGKKDFEVIAVARREEKLEKLKCEMNGKCRIIPLDLSIEKNCYKLHDLMMNTEIDILINNAGFGKISEFNKISLNDEIKMIDINVKALHILTKLFLNDMIKLNKGYILNVSSSAAFMPCGPYMSTYYATKSYVYSLSLGISTELIKNKSKVKLGVLCPGPVQSEFNKIAGGKFTKKVLSSEKVAKYTVKMILNGKTKIIPGLSNKVLYTFSRIMPERILSKINLKIQKSKMN